MRIRVSIAIALVAFLVLPGLVFAEAAKPAKAPSAAPSATLEYYESPDDTLTVKDGTGKDQGLSFGMDLKVGWTVVTLKGDYAEIKMQHTGTIIKVSQNTNFTLEALRSDTGGQDAFKLGVGKIRTVAGKASGKDQYQIKTQSAVMGVRGSDVVAESPDGDSASLFTLEGIGWLKKATGEELEIAQGFFADTLAAVFEAIEIPKDLFDSLLKEMSFTKLDVDEAMRLNKEFQESLKVPAEAPPAAPEKKPPEAPPPAPAAAPSFLDDIMAKVREILGMEIGSITIGDTTYSKVVMQPQFALGALKMGLYLPIIYNGDMFNPNDWYKPSGNNEWSFGMDQTGTIPIVVDAAADLFLKIKYLEWGSQRDPFFFKVGNLNDITIGHGLIMRNFANDADFPAVRRVGVNLGLDFTGFGFEAMVNDVAAPDIFGGRLYIRPIPNFRAALGLSTLVDWSPGKDFKGGKDLAGDPLFINPGVDLDLPFFESDFLSIVSFADAAVMVPYFRSQPDTTLTGGKTIKTGPALDAVVVDPSLGSSIPVKNWGVAAGLFGNLIIRDFTWRLEFRDYTGTFKPQFYSSGYERQRTEFVSDVLAYLGNTADPKYDVQTMGIFGEGGFKLPKLFDLSLSYFWPWYQDPVTQKITMDPNDHFVAKFTLEKGVIPVVNIHGNVSYERTRFVPTILQSGIGTGLNLFDANTVVSAEVYYPVAPTLDVKLLYTTTAKRNPDGTLSYTGSSLLPDLNTTLGIETQVHF